MTDQELIAQAEADDRAGLLTSPALDELERRVVDLNAQHIHGDDLQVFNKRLACRAEWREKRRNQRARARERGHCIECEAALTEHDGVRCTPCRLLNRERARERRRQRAAAGLCGCGRPLPKDRSHKTCDACRARTKAHYRAGLPEDRQRHLDWKRGGGQERARKVVRAGLPSTVNTPMS